MLIGIKDRLDKYLNTTRTVIKWLHLVKYSVALALLFVSFKWFTTWVKGDLALGGTTYYHVFFRRLLTDPSMKAFKLFFHAYVSAGFALVWMSLFTRIENILKFTVLKSAENKVDFQKMMADSDELPEWPYKRDGFSVVLAEIQDQDGSRVPNEKSPDKRPKWLVLTDKALYTGLLVTGGIGSGKTASVALPLLEQMINHHREVPVIEKIVDEKTFEVTTRKTTKRYVWSGLVTDEKGDFSDITRGICKRLGREKDFIRLAPGGFWLWNAIYNPGQPTWAVGYTLGKILDRFNKGAKGNDPFWTNAPKDLILEYLTLMNYATGYYSIGDFLRVLISEKEQESYYEMALDRLRHDEESLSELERCWNRIFQRNVEMPPQLKNSLQSCAKAGLGLFEYQEIRETFSPEAKDYFTGPCCPWPRRKPKSVEDIKRFEMEHMNGLKLPKPNVFTGFDAHHERGTIVALDMPKTRYKASAEFVQVGVKAQGQETIFRRDTRDESGKLYLPPRFGEASKGGLGYCPFFIFADECQESVDPDDQNFMAQCRSKKAACVWLTQSHTSIIAAMEGKKESANAFFNNTMTHIYLRQNDVESMEIIEKEVGTKPVVKTTFSIAEGGTDSSLEFSAGDIVNKGVGITETQSTAYEEKPLFEKKDMKTLPNFTAIIIASTGESALPATIGYLRPPYIFDDEKMKARYPGLKREMPWHRWPGDLRARATLENLPQETTWKGWGIDGIEESEIGLSGFTSDYQVYDEGGLERENKIRGGQNAGAGGGPAKAPETAQPEAQEQKESGLDLNVDDPDPDSAPLDPADQEANFNWEQDFIAQVQEADQKMAEEIAIAEERNGWGRTM